MNEEDENELAARRAYDDFKGHFERYLKDHGAQGKDVPVIVRSMIWWASVMAKVDGWLRWVIAAAMVASTVALIGSLALKDLIGGIR